MKKPQPGTYQDKALTYLKTGHSLGLPKALALFGICRLSDAVHSLREKGYDIRTHLAETPEGKQFSYYTLPKTIDKDTRGGTRVRVKRGTAAGAFSDQAGTIEKVTVEGPEMWEVLVRIDGEGSYWFDLHELEPEYVNA